VRSRLAARALLGLGAFAIVAPGEAGPAAQAAPIPAWAGTLDTELAAIASDARRPLASLSVLATRDGRVVYQRHFGRRRIDPANAARDLPANEATLYRVASISKMVATLVVMRLVDEDKLDLDADVGSYLGHALRNPHFPDTPITLRMLLSHTASLRDDAGYFWDESASLRDVLVPGGRLHGSGAMWSAQAKPGAWFHYANLGWGIAGTVVERATGERFDHAARRLVLQPLGMAGGFSPADLPKERWSDIATLYRKRAAGDDRQPWNPQGPWIPQVDDYSREAPAARGSGYVPGSNATVFGPQGGLRATVADLGRVLGMLAGGGELDGRRFLSRRAVDEMLAIQWRHDGRNGDRDYGNRRSRLNAWGLGLQRFLDASGPAAGDRLVEGGGFPAVGHLGDAYGLTGVVALDPASGNGMVVLVGGTGFDPDTDPGAYSSLARYEERILTALHRRAILGKPD